MRRGLVRGTVALALLAGCAARAFADSDGPGYPERLHSLVVKTRAAILALPARNRTADDLAMLDGPMARLDPLALGNAPAPLGVVSRSWEGRFERGRRLLEAPDSVKAVARELLLWWHSGGARDRMRTALPAEVFKAADDAVEEYNDDALAGAIGRMDRRLDRYEVKFGPGSPKLNLIEMALNAALQGTKPFRPNDDGPSPNELVLGYSTAWATVTDDQAKAVSTLELGWRRYDLGWNERVHSSWRGLLRPRYASMGIVLAETRDGALRWPLDGVRDAGTRAGPFLSLGDLRFAYLFGPSSRFLMSRQVQLLPNLF